MPRGGRISHPKSTPRRSGGVLCFWGCLGSTPPIKTRQKPAGRSDGALWRIVGIDRDWQEDSATRFLRTKHLRSGASINHPWSYSKSGYAQCLSATHRRPIASHFEPPRAMVCLTYASLVSSATVTPALVRKKSYCNAPIKPGWAVLVPAPFLHQRPALRDFRWLHGSEQNKTPPQPVAAMGNDADCTQTPRARRAAVACDLLQPESKMSDCSLMLVRLWRFEQ